jgi:hypothetical protein
MLMSPSRAWTRLQKWLIALGVVVGIAAFACVIYTYERYHRGLSETAFFGTWKTTFDDADSPSYLRLSPDQTFDMASSPAIDDQSIFLWGRWYAGGPNFYLRFNADVWGSGTRPYVCKIEDISETHFSIRVPSGVVYAYERVK